MGKEPQKIFLEMARGEETSKIKKKTKTISKKNWLQELYRNCEIGTRNRFLEEITSREERDFNSRKLFLYYTQMGKCMYSGEDIDFDELMRKNSKWDKDHIFPQSKMKDDSIDNLVLVNKKLNSKKSNGVLDADIQRKEQSFWRMLLDKGFISKKKYDRLMKKGDFTEEELSGFISRQLVETRQSTKILADTFKRIYREADLVYVKANLVSEFRHDTLEMLKSRRVNDFHHAHDAYLNIVVGNVYNAKFTSNPIKWMKEHKGTEYSLNTVFKFDVYRGNTQVWDANKECGSLVTVKKVMESNHILYTEHTYCEKGELFKETLKKKNENSCIPIKLNLDTAKYGGYYSPTSSYFACIEFEDKKKNRVRNIIAVPLYIANRLEYDSNAFIDYCKTVKRLEKVNIIYPKIKKNSLLVFNGFPMRIRGESDKDIILKNNLQLKLDRPNTNTVRLIEKYLNWNADYKANEDIDKINHEMLDELYDAFIDKLKTVYGPRPANQYSKLEEGRDKFILSTNLSDKMKLLNNILNLLRCDATTTADLSLILQEKKNVGSMKIKKSTLGKGKLILVNQSVTGLFENRKEL